MLSSADINRSLDGSSMDSAKRSNSCHFCKQDILNLTISNYCTHCGTNLKRRQNFITIQQDELTVKHNKDTFKLLSTTYNTGSISPPHLPSPSRNRKVITHNDQLSPMHLNDSESLVEMSTAISSPSKLRTNTFSELKSMPSLTSIIKSIDEHLKTRNQLNQTVTIEDTMLVDMLEIRNAVNHERVYKKRGMIRSSTVSEVTTNYKTLTNNDLTQRNEQQKLRRTKDKKKVKTKSEKKSWIHKLQNDIENDRKISDAISRNSTTVSYLDAVGSVSTMYEQYVMREKQLRGYASVNLNPLPKTDINHYSKKLGRIKLAPLKEITSMELVVDDDGGDNSDGNDILKFGHIQLDTNEKKKEMETSQSWFWGGVKDVDNDERMVMDTNESENDVNDDFVKQSEGENYHQVSVVINREI